MELVLRDNSKSIWFLDLLMNKLNGRISFPKFNKIMFRVLDTSQVLTVLDFNALKPKSFLGKI
jgi:hypothetical protein